MAKVTSKLQVTIPKAIAERYGIEPGDEIEFRAGGPFIHVVPPRRNPQQRLSPEEKLRRFEASVARQRAREKTMTLSGQPATERGWKREDLYGRGEPR